MPSLGLSDDILTRLSAIPEVHYPGSFNVKEK